ncbi:hypothetical protein MRB53_013377 [Persea americana]|uniref:Uncharacterized protein n=1 Tax=Persea americana TaxID=3435 RepID=A0ACC2K7W8_PERAE|nr:hypothetical protein MRB53_013377 [Persea americana]
MKLEIYGDIDVQCNVLASIFFWHVLGTSGPIKDSDDQYLTLSIETDTRVAIWVSELWASLVALPGQTVDSLCSIIKSSNKYQFWVSADLQWSGREGDVISTQAEKERLDQRNVSLGSISWRCHVPSTPAFVAVQMLSFIPFISITQIRLH